MRDSAANASPRDGFFLPDLCATQPLLLLVLVSQLMAILVVLARSGLSGFDWDDFGLVSFAAIWVALPGAFFLCKLRPLLSRLPLAWGAACSYNVVLILSAAVSTGGLMFMRQQWHLQSPDVETVLVNVLLTAIVTGIMFRYLYLQQRLSLQQQAELKARLDALQARIHPHFLFNSMNIIASLIPTRPDAAEQAVEDLAELFRASLARAGTEVTLAHELELCRRYLALESLRLGDRLKLEWQVDEAPEQLPIPLLTLQPLLENAVVHGIQPRVDGGTIRVSIAYRDGRVEIVVSNPVTDIGIQQGGNRMALDNIRDRLSNLYGDDVSLLFHRGEDMAVVRLSYPVRGVA
ncbi:MAG TPA: sensor histidine kinase [Pseudomonadales bacterium]